MPQNLTTSHKHTIDEFATGPRGLVPLFEAPRRASLKYTVPLLFQLPVAKRAQNFTCNVSEAINGIQWQHHGEEL